MENDSAETFQDSIFSREPDPLLNSSCQDVSQSPLQDFCLRETSDPETTEIHSGTNGLSQNSHVSLNADVPHLESTTDQHSDPHQDTLMTDEQMTSPKPIDNQDTGYASREVIQLSDWVDIPNVISPKRPRFFLEFFSGKNHPLSSYISSLGVATLQPFDILLHSDMDILDDACFDTILRLIATRQIGTLMAAPPCTEYSLLKLKQPGPKPCRLPDRLDEPLFDDAECHERFFSSREILRRTATALHVNHIHGGYSGLEQPLNAMSWNEPFIKEARTDFLTEAAILSHCQVKDQDTTGLNKHWLFVSNIPDFHRADLQCVCQYKHDSFAGVKEQDGSYSSKQTAEYTCLLVQHLSRFLRLEPSDVKQTECDFVEWSWIQHNLPSRPPLCFQHIPDGAGLVSTALWPLPFKTDVFYPLRKKLEYIATSFKLTSIIPKHIQNKTMGTPFSDEVIKATQEAFVEFFQFTGHHPSLEITSGQPFRLHALMTLATVMADPDVQLIPQLISGVDLGVDTPIPSSHTWPPRTNLDITDPEDKVFQICSENWHSADADDDTLAKLIQQEIDDGLVVEVGSLEAAQERFGKLLAVGKLGIASQQPNKPRLVLDSTISGLNPLSQQAIQEKCSYPRLSHLQQCVSSAVCQPCKFLNLDIKSAHKRIKQFRDRIYHYQVLHFGGTCSAYYWTRLAAIILRFFHHFLYIYHFGMVFVDDFIFGLDPVAAPLQTSTLLLCCAFLNIPLSWHKLELGHQITWIGWRIDAWSDTVSIPEEKMSKLLRNLRALTTAGKFKRSDVEAVAGHLLWISEIFPFIRWSLGTLYTILSRPGIQLVRLNKEQIKSVLSSLTDSGQMSVFLQRPYIPQGSILSRMGKLQFHPGNVSQFAQSCFDLNFAWASFWNCRSNRVQIFEPEADILQPLYSMILDQIPRTALSCQKRYTLQAGADAFATKDKFGIGAWLTTPSHDRWISMVGDTTDLPQEWHVDDLQKLIISFETLAQCLILLLFISTTLRGADFEIVSKVDNQASEAILAQGFTQIPLSSKLMRTVQKLSYQSNVILQPYRCTSADNSRADDLSRGRISQESSNDRLSLSFSTLFQTIFPD